MHRNAPRQRTVGAYEAKTHLPALLKEVERGKEIVITRREKPIARIVPIVSEKLLSDAAFERLRKLRGIIRLKKNESVKDLINAGRRI